MKNEHLNIRLLAIDTSTDACSAALYINGKIFDHFEIAPQQHTKLLLPMIDQLLKEADLKLNSLDAIAFGRGPGSFTGLRIATATAQGLGFGTHLPLIPVSTLRALAQQAYSKHHKTSVMAWLDARMQQIYWGLFEMGSEGIMQAKSEERVQAENDILLPPGDWYRYTEYPRAHEIAIIAAHEFQLGNTIPATEAMPFYIRDEVASSSASQFKK